MITIESLQHWIAASRSSGSNVANDLTTVISENPTEKYSLWSAPARQISSLSIGQHDSPRKRDARSDHRTVHEQMPEKLSVRRGPTGNVHGSPDLLDVYLELLLGQGDVDGGERVQRLPQPLCRRHRPHHRLLR